MATKVPVQLLNPVGSTTGQAITSTGPGAAPFWNSPLFYVLSSSSDNTTGLQAAVNNAQTIGAQLVLIGSGPMSGTVNITAAISIVGQGRNFTVITASTTGSVFNITTGAQVTMSGFTIQNSVTAGNAQVGITVNPVGGANLYSTFRDMSFIDEGTGINFVAAAEWRVDNCYFLMASGSTYGVSVANTFIADEGDSTIINSVFTTNGTVVPGQGVHQVSSGGLRLINNKFNFITNPYVLNLGSGASTTDLIVANNSFENFVTNAIVLERQAATGTFGHVQIIGNEFADPSSTANTNYILVPSDPNGVWLTGLQINDNTFNINSSGTNVGVNISTVTGFTISNNIFINITGTTKMVQTNSNASFGVVGPNITVGTFSASSISSTNTTTISPF